MKSPISLDIADAMRDFKTNPSKQTAYAVIQAFSHAVSSNEWVFMPIVDKGRGPKPLYLPNNGTHYIAIYSSYSSRKHQKISSVMCTDVNKVIDSVYAYPLVAGIIIDPFDTEPYIIKRKDIDFFTSRKDPRRQPKDWGTGVPNYMPNDVMTAEELLDFAVETICDFCVKKEGFEIIEVRSGLDDIPNIVARKDGKFQMIIVEASVAPHMPKLSRVKEVKILKHAAQFDAISLYAAVGFGATDPARFEESLALYGDSFYANFKGFQVLRRDETPQRSLKELLDITQPKSSGSVEQSESSSDTHEDDPIM